MLKEVKPEVLCMLTLLIDNNTVVILLTINKVFIKSTHANFNNFSSKQKHMKHFFSIASKYFNKTT